MSTSPIIDVAFGKRPGKILLGGLLALVLFLPTLTFYIGVATSMALGACAVAVVVILASLSRFQTFGSARLSIGALIAMALAAVLVHLVIAALMRPVDVVRASLSLIPLVLVLLSGFCLGRLMRAGRHAATEGAVYFCLALSCVSGLVALFGLVPPNSGAYFKPVFPFTEPSHFALSFLPVFMYACVRLNGRAKVAVLLGGLFMGWSLESLTLIVGWLLVAFICVRKSSIALMLAALALLGTQLDLSYYLDRLDFGGDAQNVSALVYVQGWQLVVESLGESSGWGLGLQQLGVQGSHVEAADLIFATLGESSNLLDGGFTFAKLVSEFGVLGLLLTISYLVLAHRCALALRCSSRGSLEEMPATTLAQCVVVCFLVEMFVRGEGYFSGTTLLLCAAVTILSMQPESQAQEAKVSGRRSVRRGGGRSLTMAATGLERRKTA